MAKAKKNALFDKAHEVESELNKNSEILDKNIQVESISENIEESPIAELPIVKTATENQEKLE